MQSDEAIKKQIDQKAKAVVAQAIQQANMRTPTGISSQKHLLKPHIHVRADYTPEHDLIVMIDPTQLKIAIPEKFQGKPSIVADQVAVDIGLAIAEMLVPKIKEAMK